MDAMDFFELSAGKWRSQRTTQHLAFRRSETGESEISVKTLTNDDPKVREICELHNINPELAAGGALVTWQGTMDWDKEDENHSGSTVIVIVPDPDNPQQGQLLRERGYAEIAPVAGRYLIDKADGMVLLTEYETMSSEERFWFPSPNLRMRTSNVKRFGGFSTASLCTEIRMDNDPSGAIGQDTPTKGPEKLANNTDFYSALGW